MFIPSFVISFIEYHALRIKKEDRIRVIKRMNTLYYPAIYFGFLFVFILLFRSYEVQKVSDGIHDKFKYEFSFEEHSICTDTTFYFLGVSKENIYFYDRIINSASIYSKHNLLHTNIVVNTKFTNIFNQMSQVGDINREVAKNKEYEKEKAKKEKRSKRKARPSS